MVTIRGHPHQDWKRRRTRNKWGSGLLLCSLRCPMICKSWGRREIKRFTILGNMNQAFKHLSQEI